MESEAKYTLVGAAVLILLALAAATVVWLRSSGEGAGAQQFKIYFEQQSLEGLELRSYVTMRGIRVGSVTGFRFSSSRPGAVEVFISVDPSAPVRQNTQAIVERHLVTGLASVRLVNPNEDSPLLEATPPGEPYPVIAEGESTIQAVSDTVTQLARRADDTMQRVNEVLSPENRRRSPSCWRTCGACRGTRTRSPAAPTPRWPRWGRRRTRCGRCRARSPAMPAS
jgi:phospholipid/cholesterol/gamma-HCH transport system substrate-binding protein